LTLTPQTSKMKNLLIFLLIPLLVVSSALAQENNLENKLATANSTSKAFARGIFNVIQFPNTGCAAGSGRNGTCYTSSECTSKGGTSDGTCANGYGVCCVIKLTCGQTTSENNSYLIVGPTTSPQMSCVFTICRAGSDICRIRLDFNTFDINGPFTGTVVAASVNTALIGNSIGDCTVDSFSATTPGNMGTPVICGFNTGQHMYLDASSVCSRASFDFGTFSSTSRTVDIKVTQYPCGDENGGPEDCLQYFTSATGTVSSYNFRTDSNGFVTSTATHLSNQLYDMCFRRAVGKCALCLIPAINGNALNMQSSFGLSNPDAATGGSGSRVDTACSTDYLIIPNGVSVAIATFVDGVTNKGKDRFCGRYLNAANAIQSSVSICTARRPFRITFRTDADEITSIAAGSADPLDEQAVFPGGIVGFSLAYTQTACP